MFGREESRQKSIELPSLNALCTAHSGVITLIYTVYCFKFAHMHAKTALPFRRRTPVVYLRMYIIVHHILDSAVF